ncbi:MAG: hypothetical protein ACQES8_06065 [Thermodesulfobacteriota bacterium]
MKKKLKQEVLVGCLDVLCRARASADMVENDPYLRTDISDAIESLTKALQGETQSDESTKYKKDNAEKYVSLHEDDIVDVLTNEVIYKFSKSKK